MDFISNPPQAAIFDMDGLLLDTEPLWRKSMVKITKEYGLEIKADLFRFTTGLRIYEVTEFWKNHLPWDTEASTQEVAEAILDEIIRSAKAEGKMMPGAKRCIQFLKNKGLKIGLATSSPMRMVQELITAFNLASLFDELVSADTVKIGKPHPAVFIECASLLQTPPTRCVAFEDSLNGLIAAKAARMKVVIVPERAQFNDSLFSLADIKLQNLNAFNEQVWRKFLI